MARGTIRRMRRPLTMVQLGVGVMLLLVCVSVAVLMRARTVLGERSAVLASRQTVLASCSPKACCSRSAAVRSAPPSPRHSRAVIPRPCSRVSARSGSTPACRVHCRPHRLCDAGGGILPARASRTDTATRGWLGALTLAALVAVQGDAGIRAHRCGRFCDASGRRSAKSRRRHQPGGSAQRRRVPAARPYVTRNVSGPGRRDRRVQPRRGRLRSHSRGAADDAGRRPGGGRALTHSPQPVRAVLDRRRGTHARQPGRGAPGRHGKLLQHGGDSPRSWPGFSAADQPDSPWVVLVNETLATQQWPNGDPIGQRLTLTFSPNDEEAAREVVGLVADTIPFRGASEVPPLIYVLHRQQATRAARLARKPAHGDVVHRSTSGDPLALGDAVRAQVGKVDATTPVASIRTVESYLNAGQTALLQYGETLLGIVALVALVAVRWASTPSPPTASPIVNRCSRSASSWWRRSSSERLRDGPAGCGSPASSRRFSRISRSRRQIPCRSSSPAAYPGDCARHFFSGFLVGARRPTTAAAETSRYNHSRVIFTFQEVFHAS